MGQVDLNEGLMGYGADAFRDNVVRYIDNRCFECDSKDVEITEYGKKCYNCGGLFVNGK